MKTIYPLFLGGLLLLTGIGYADDGGGVVLEEEHAEAVAEDEALDPHRGAEGDFGEARAEMAGEVTRHTVSPSSLRAQRSNP